MMVTERQITGLMGELYVAKHCTCPKCKIGRFVGMSISNFPCADLICKFCGQLIQVKTKKVKNKNQKIKKVGGAAWSPFKKRIESGIFYPLFIVKIIKNKPFSILFISEHTQKEIYDIDNNLYVSRKPLGNHCKRAGWQGFNYNLDLIPEKLIRILK